jgi:hypothetical protein
MEYLGQFLMVLGVALIATAAFMTWYDRRG